MKWLAIIKNAEKRKHFTMFEEDRADDWECGPIGEKAGTRADQIDFFAKNLTAKAKSLGTEFSANVYNGDFKQAKKTLKKIHKLDKVII